MLREPVDPVVHLPEELVPQGFIYPSSFSAFVSSALGRELLDGEPWTLFHKRLVSQVVANVRQQNQHLSLVPFALRQYTNHVACFDGNSTDGLPKVAIVRLHDGTDDGGTDGYIHPEYDVPGWLNSFESWVSLATDDSADFRRVHHGG